MELKEKEEKLLTGYLLGDLSDSEKTQIETRFFADDEYYENLLVAEDELIYNYLRGGLSSRERDLFAAQIAASPKRREKVQFVKALMAEATETATNRTTVARLAVVPHNQQRASWWLPVAAFLTARNAVLQLAMAAGVVLLTIAGFWLWTQTRQLNTELQLAQAQYEQSAREAAQREQFARQQANDLQKEKTDLAEKLKQEQAAREQLAKEKERLENRVEIAATRTALIIPFTLEPGIRSESEAPGTIRVPHQASSIQLTLALGSDDGSGKYRAELSSRGGTLVWSQDDLSSKQMAWGKAVVLPVPAGVFRNSEYDLTLKRAVGKGQMEDVGYYYFKVVKH